MRKFSRTPDIFEKENVLKFPVGLFDHGIFEKGIFLGILSKNAVSYFCEK
jgi:hypothetical protein